MHYFVLVVVLSSHSNILPHITMPLRKFMTFLRCGLTERAILPTLLTPPTTCVLHHSPHPGARRANGGFRFLTFSVINRRTDDILLANVVPVLRRSVRVWPIIRTLLTTILGGRWFGSPASRSRGWFWNHLYPDNAVG